VQDTNQVSVTQHDLLLSPGKDISHSQVIQGQDMMGNFGSTFITHKTSKPSVVNKKMTNRVVHFDHKTKPFIKNVDYAGSVATQSQQSN
jgi:hypothetical protein